MSFLADNSLVLSLAEWIWGHTEASICLDGIPFMPGTCWSALISKALGIAIILGAFLNKAPIIVNLIESESTEGLSKLSILGDILVYMSAFCYGYLEQMPVTAYGENAALLMQSIVILFLVWKFSSSVALTEQLAVFAAFFCYAYGVNNFLQPEHHYLLMAVTYPAGIFARGSQIYATHQVKHTGANSIITTTLNLVGSLIRILTTLQEVGVDIPVLTGFGLSVVLNGTCFVQHYIYWDNTEAYLVKLEESKKPKTEIHTLKPGQTLKAKKKEE